MKIIPRERDDKESNTYLTPGKEYGVRNESKHGECVYGTITDDMGSSLLVIIRSHYFECSHWSPGYDIINEEGDFESK